MKSRGKINKKSLNKNFNRLDKIYVLLNGIIFIICLIFNIYIILFTKVIF